MSEIACDEYVAKKGEVSLQLYRKRLAARAGEDLPGLFLVHGSSFSARTTYDLEVPGGGEYSLMNVFARHGFDVWTMDHEGYGRSSRTDGFSTVRDGVADLEAAAALIEAECGKARLAYFGSSSGALRAGAFANRHPERVAKLALAAFVWTGEGSPTLEKRRERLDEWRSTNRRTVDEAAYRAIFTRDVTGLTIPELAAFVAAAEIRNGGGSVPNGTYIDMCIHLPLVDPEAIACPVLMFRGDHDGIATDADVRAFFDRLPVKDKQYVMLSGQAHNTTLGVNRARFWHVLHAFLTLPERIDDLERGSER